MSKILVVVAHPDIANSRANKAVINALAEIDGVTIHHLYQQYPDFKINIQAEQQLLTQYDHIVLQFPFFWYSMPALLKEWLDSVWAWGFAFGTDGNALQGKKLLISTTTGSPSEAYAADGQNLYTVEELMRPMLLTARLCKMEYQTPLAIGFAKRISNEVLAAEVARIATEVKNLTQVEA